MSQREPSEWAAHWLRGAMRFAGITAAELARRSGVPDTYISKVVCIRCQPTTKQLVKLIEACGCEIIELRVRKKINSQPVQQ